MPCAVYIETDGRVTYHEFWASLDIDTSRTRAILHKNLKMKKPTRFKGRASNLVGDMTQQTRAEKAIKRIHIKVQTPALNCDEKSFASIAKAREWLFTQPVQTSLNHSVCFAPKAHTLRRGPRERLRLKPGARRYRNDYQEAVATQRTAHAHKLQPYAFAISHRYYTYLRAYLRVVYNICSGPF
ncbi:hypothetical protein EVAR_10709_1 [Eumeta japonica]|uniref:Uncharacterized protein n=1 Tax=Eumeta variegata TaxID=151549 RepID=A0A4C1U7A5_EUMVA|nr:hypothetical protein EVAR_10709_1 [Eumeta japonica]